MHCLQLSDTQFIRPPAQDTGFIVPKFHLLLEEGYPIVEIQAREMSGLGLPLFSCYQ